MVLKPHISSYCNKQKKSTLYGFTFFVDGIKRWILNIATESHIDVGHLLRKANLN